MECPRARERIRLGLPDNMGPTAPTSTSQGSGVANDLLIAATENFITLLDAIKLGWNEKDQLHPFLVDIMTSVNKVTDKEFNDKSKIVQWLITLNQMTASEKLNEEQSRQFQFDIQQAYNGFKASL
jgi:ESCRT-I complex subunit VPS28